MNKLYLIIISIIVLMFLPSKVLSKDIEIGLITSKNEIKIGSNKKATLINLYTNKEISKINNGETYSIHNSNGLVSISHNFTNTVLGAFTGPVKLAPKNKNGLIFCNNRWYRGELIILTNRTKKELTVVNKLNLEDYLLSVVPSEIPNSWQKEGLKAQSIASRSYALGYLNRRRSKGYDLEASVEDQAYLGVSAEKKATSLAVKETAGEVLLDKDNKPLIALYHSSGGGYTDSIENLWETNGVKASVHIQPRPDYDDNSPHFKWYRDYNLTEVNKKLLSKVKVGEVTNIIPISRSPAQRVMWIEISGTEGKAKIRGEDFRRCLNLPSSKFNLSIEENHVKFAGRGYGHGLGLSQWGTKALAEKGFTYKQILAHYYPGTNLIKLSED